MVSEEDLERLGKDQASRRQAGRLNQELEPTDLKHKSAKELREIEEAIKKIQEAIKKEQEARMKAEKECDELRSLLAKHKGSVTPTNKGTSGSDDSPPTKSKKILDVVKLGKPEVGDKQSRLR